MDETPNRRPGMASAVAAAAVLLVVFAVLFSQAFSGVHVLFTEGKTVGQWDAHLVGGAWNAQDGLGSPRDNSRLGFSGLFQKLCAYSPDPAANFANYHPLACLMLLGMSAWLCARQLGARGILCLLAALAASLNGYFISQTLEHSGAIAVLGATLFFALAMILSPRFSWPHGLAAGAALGVGILETGTMGLYPVVAIAAMTGALGIGDADRALCARRLLATGALALGAVLVGWPMLSQLPFAGPDLAPLDLLTLPAAGLFGHRADVADNSQHWGSLAGSHFHLHAGALVLLGAAWASINALRKESTLSRTDRYRVLMFGGAGIVAVGAMLGGVSGGSLLAFCSVALLVVFTLGMKGLDEWQASEAHEQTRGFGSGGFDSRWRIGMFALLALATVGFAIYNAQSAKLANWMAVPNVTKEEVGSLVSSSIFQAGMFVLFLFLSVIGLTICGMVKWNTRPAVLATSLLALLLTADLARTASTFLRFDDLAAHYRENPLTAKLENFGAFGRLTLLNDYRTSTNAPLDVMVSDEFHKPKPPNAFRFEEAPDLELAKTFHGALSEYNNGDHMDEFNKLLTQLLNSGDAKAQQNAFNILQQLPGGQAFIDGAKNENLSAFFMEAALQRRFQLRAREHIAALSLSHHADWARHLFPQQGIVLANPRDFRAPTENDIDRGEALRRLVRQWELSSTRFFLCHSGTESISKLTQAEAQRYSLPTYHNLLDKSIDPVLRRFRLIQPLHFTAPANTTNSPPIVLMEFTGALPRVELFADWMTGVDEKKTDAILFSPGFDPHSRVLLRETGLPEPEQPSQLTNLPEVTFEENNATRIRLRIPPTDFGSMLLLNDRHHPNWTATLDGQPAKILLANNHARALHIPAADANRTVIFSYTPPATATPPTTVLFLIALAVAGVGASQQRSRETDESGIDAEETGEDDDESSSESDKA